MANQLQPYGVGLAYRTVLHNEIFAHAAEIDLLEIPTEDYIVRRRRLWTDPTGSQLQAVTDRFPCVAHGIGLSLGSVEPLDLSILDRTARLLEETGIRVFSEHLAFHRIEKRDLTVFLSLPFDDVAIDWVAENYCTAQAALGRGFALENVSYYFPVPDSQYDEPAYLNGVLERTNATLLLDVTNVFNNCTNHHQDPVEYIRRLDGNRISQIHLAGGHYEDGFLLDSHSQPVMDEVWDLFDVAMEHTAANIVIIERDSNFRPFGPVIDDVCKAREIFRRHRPTENPAGPASGTESLPRETAATTRCDSPKYADLKSFQRALFREITDDHIRLQARMDSEPLRELFSMSPEWFDRLLSCPEKQIDDLARRWKWFESARVATQSEYRRWEWDCWSRANDI